MFSLTKLRVPVVLMSCLFAITACKPAQDLKAPAPVSAIVDKSKISTRDAQYPPDFQVWLENNPVQRPQFEALKTFLTRKGVADVLPIWHLIQTETLEAAAKCGVDAYEVPPENLWPAMVPTLQLVRQEIIPLLGPVKVLSSFRSEAANRCSSGAPGSPHKSYSALDLAVISDLPQKEIFAKLCKRWDQLPSSVGFGLGAYYTRHQPDLNSEGRFHVDTMGRRTWGFGYGAYTSHCRELGYITVKSPKQIKLDEELKIKAEADAMVKLEKEEKAKLLAVAKLKSDIEVSDKLKAKQAVQLKIAEAARAESSIKPIEIIAPPQLQTSDNVMINKMPSSKN